MRRETLTPPSSVESSTQGIMENGYPVQSSDDSGSDNNCDEAPLDFSVRKRSDSVDDLGSDGNGDLQSRNSETGSQSAGESSAVSNGTDTPPQTLTNGTLEVKSEPLSPQPALVNEAEDLTGKIGEPQLALPGVVPGAVFPGPNAIPPGLNAAAVAAAAAAGILPPSSGMLGALPLPTGVFENKKAQQNNSKPTRPFKAYPKDPLSLPLGYYGIPGMLPGLSLPAIDPSTVKAMNANAEELFNHYRMLLAAQEVNGKPVVSKEGHIDVVSGSHESSDNTIKCEEQRPVSPSSSISSNASLSPRRTSVMSPHSHSDSMSPPTAVSRSTTSPVLSVGFPPGPFTSPSMMGTSQVTSTSNSNTPPRKKARILPEDRKDAAYWERRRKNNEAAKRSRDARRAKEDEIAIRAAFLEQENLKLRVEVAALKNETAKLRCMLYNS